MRSPPDDIDVSSHPGLGHDPLDLRYLLQFLEVNTKLRFNRFNLLLEHILTHYILIEKHVLLRATCLSHLCLHFEVCCT